MFTAQRQSERCRDGEAKPRVDDGNVDTSGIVPQRRFSFFQKVMMLPNLFPAAGFTSESLQ